MRNEQEATLSALKPGELVPHFTLHTTPNWMVSLSQFRGNQIILAFYPKS